MADDDYVREKTRRIVARSALRQASVLVQEWQADAENNARWARRLSAVFAVAALVAILFFIFH